MDKYNGKLLVNGAYSETWVLAPDALPAVRSSLRPHSIGWTPTQQRRMGSWHHSVLRSHNMKPMYVLGLSALIASLSGPSLAAEQGPAKANAVAEQASHPTCRYCPNPPYPAKARKAGISAKVLLEVTVSERGDVDPRNIRVIEDPGHGFAQQAVAAIKKWKFNPATLKDGKPTKTRTRVELNWESF